MGSRSTYGAKEDGTSYLVGDEARCTLCGNPAWSGVWFSGDRFRGSERYPGPQRDTLPEPVNAVGEIYLCEKCALDTVPALLADTLAKPGRCSYRAGAALWEKMRSTFWKAWRLAVTSIRITRIRNEEFKRDLIAFHLDGWQEGDPLPTTEDCLNALREEQVRKQAATQQQQDGSAKS